MTSPYDQAIAKVERNTHSLSVHEIHVLSVLRSKRQGWLECCRELLPRIPENDLTDEEIAFIQEGT